MFTCIRSGKRDRELISERRLDERSHSINRPSDRFFSFKHGRLCPCVAHRIGRPGANCISCIFCRITLARDGNIHMCGCDACSCSGISWMSSDPLGAIDSRLGVHVDNVMFRRQPSPTDEIVHFLNRNACDLVVLATHGRDGLDHWLKGSVAETVFRRSAIPTLFIPPSARGFVDQVTGDLRLRRVLVPVDHSPVPYRAIEAARRFPLCSDGHRHRHASVARWRYATHPRIDGSACASARQCRANDPGCRD